MRRAPSGFTIIEVLIVLGITTFLIGLSLTYLGGREGHVHFSQTMRDTQSKFQQWMNDVTNGFPTGTNVDHCTASGLKVTIDSGKSPIGYAGACIFLGKAIQVEDKSTQIYAYPVFGLAQASGNLPSSLTDTSPTPAIGGGAASTGTAALSESYSLGGGTYVKGVCKSTGCGSPYDPSNHMIGLYLSLNNDSNAGQNGASDLKGYQYPLPSVDPYSTDVRNCINMNIYYTTAPTNCKLAAPLINPEPPVLTTWQICFANNANTDTAVLTLRGGGSGIGVTTQLEYKQC